MPKKSETVAIKARWKIESPVILKANAFRTVYTPFSTVLYFGLVDPEDMLPETRGIGNFKEIKTLARYSLDHDELIRLKKEIDKTVERLRKSGVLKDAK